MPASRETITADRAAVPLTLAHRSVEGCVDAHVAALEQQVAALEREVADLREAVITRQLIGWSLGLLAERLGLSHDQAWSFITRLSQNTNVRIRDVARIVSDAYEGALSPSDQAVAAQLTAQLGDARKLFRRSGSMRRPDHGRS